MITVRHTVIRIYQEMRRAPGYNIDQVHANIQELLNQDLHDAVQILDVPLGQYNHRSGIMFRMWLDEALLYRTNVAIIRDCLIHMTTRARTDVERLQLLKEQNAEEMSRLAPKANVVRNSLIGRFGSIAFLAMTCRELKDKGPQLLERIRDARLDFGERPLVFESCAGDVVSH